MTILLQGHTYGYEMECIARLFFPGERITVLRDGASDDPSLLVTAITPDAGGSIRLRAEVRLGPDGFAGALKERLSVGTGNRELERRLGVLLYRLLCEAAGKRPPWGILTGVRPVRLYRLLLEEGKNPAQARAFLTEECLVSEAKAELVARTHEAQKKIPDPGGPRDFSLYVSIPFCPTRCLYCSFVSHAIEGAAKLVPKYLELLCGEVRRIGQIAAQGEGALRTVYVGGGTPTVLEPNQLRVLLAAIRESFGLSGLLEYTVEAGRPDTVTREKLAVLREFGVGRISINPQTMQDEVLRTIGRSHTARQAEESFRLAREMGFGAINMDLIAGLPGDTADGFADTLRRVTTLAPENITLHTLTVKRSAALRAREEPFAPSPLDWETLLSEAHGLLMEAGYLPYYLYRQKGTVRNLENVGFSRPGSEGIYNVYSMEENQTILAAGAGGVTKLCLKNGKIERVFNFKYPYEYIGRFPEILDRKTAVEDYFFRNGR